MVMHIIRSILKCSEAAKIRWQDVVVDHSKSGHVEAVKVSLTFRDKEILKTTTESIVVRLMRADKARSLGWHYGDRMAA
jgi:hypothetical protein